MLQIMFNTKKIGHLDTSSSAPVGDSIFKINCQDDSILHSIIV